MGYIGDRKGERIVDLGLGFGGLISMVEVGFNCRCKDCIEENGCGCKFKKVKMSEGF